MNSMGMNSMQFSAPVTGGASAAPENAGTSQKTADPAAAVQKKEWAAPGASPAADKSAEAPSGPLDALLSAAAESLGRLAPGAGDAAAKTQVAAPAAAAVPAVSAVVPPAMMKAPQVQNPARAAVAAAAMPQGKPLAGTWAQPARAQAQGHGAPSYGAITPADYKPAVTPVPQRRWRAIKGAGLREALDTWARDAQAQLIWKAPEDFRVGETLDVSGSFETAVLSLLERYDGKGGHPVGRIYNNPDTGQKVLLIEAKGGIW